MRRKAPWKNCLLVSLLLAGGFCRWQTRSELISLQRGRLWHSFHNTQECQPLKDWQILSYGLDWPGYDRNELGGSIGGTYTYLTTGGFFLTALRTINPDTALGWMDFAINGDRNTSLQLGFQPFVSVKHEKKWRNGENYWLALNPNEAEEVIESVWEKDPQYDDSKTLNKKFPVTIKRTVRQWSGSRADEDYVIIRYLIRTSPTETKGLDSAFIMFVYGLNPNDRGWNYTNPNYSSGARNTCTNWDPVARLVTAWAGDFKLSAKDETFDYYEGLRYNAATRQQETFHEFMAPGVLGIKFLKISPDATGQPNHIHKFAWSAAPASSDYEGPFSGVAGFQEKYEAFRDPLRLYQAFDNPQDPRVGQSRLYATISLGPFNLRGRGRDSVEVVIGEFVGGLSYEQSLIETDVSKVQAAADSAVNYLNARLQFNFAHNYRVPMPPPAPDFTIYPSPTSGVVANVIAFSDQAERINDPHQGVPDLAGYRIYRAGQYPFGPWKMIQEIPAKDADFWNSDSGKYIFTDNQVALGFGYYYSVTSYDAGHSAWAIDPAVSVPSLESSVFANRRQVAFYGTLMPTSGANALARVTVVPNPFYLSSGLEKAGDEKKIQFVNVPAVCTIRIFTVRGELVKTIRHNNPASGVAVWNQISDFGQYVKSGLYFFHIETPDGQHQRGKLAIVN